MRMGDGTDRSRRRVGRRTTEPESEDRESVFRPFSPLKSMYGEDGGRSNEEEIPHGRDPPVRPSLGHLPRAQKTFVAGMEAFWIALGASTATSLAFWLPEVKFYGISMHNLLLNLAGAFIVAIVTAFQQVKFQYLQTYLMYNGIKGGFCSALTTFGNLVEETQKLMEVSPYWPSPASLFGSTILALIVYQFGRLVALMWKAGTAFSLALLKMENEDQRMALEVSMVLQEEEEEEERMSSDEDTCSSACSLGERESSGAPIWRSRSLQRLSELENVDERSLRIHLQHQIHKNQRHASIYPTRRHVIVIALGLFCVGGSALFLFVLPHGFVQDPVERDHIMYSFGIQLLCSVAGAFIGGYWGSMYADSKYQVQWGTFRVNMTSCILIAIAHNILVFRYNFPHGTEPHFVLFWQKFITNFCGTESSFAGLIDDTSTLWNSSLPRKIAARNLFYTLFLCQIFYLLVSYAIRFVVLYVGA